MRALIGIELLTADAARNRGPALLRGSAGPSKAAAVRVLMRASLSGGE
ncbi:hypothetical protein ABZT06_49745 [Streptomyces sp. NPDC005483]